MLKEAYQLAHRSSHSLPFLNDSENRHDIARKTIGNIIEPHPKALDVLRKIAREFQEPITDTRLHTPLANSQLQLENPFMVAPGLDKDGKIVRSLSALGASAVEIGAVLLRPQNGNPRPRLYEPTPKTLINAMGFNSEGVISVKRNLERYKNDPILIGVNLGLNKIVLQNKERFPQKLYPLLLAWTVEISYDHADYFVINVSSPNTPGLRDLQEEGFLTDAVGAIHEAMRKRGKTKPLYIKLAPDLDPRGTEKVVRVIEDQNLSGAICSNTTINKKIKASLGEKWVNVPGGVSGSHPDYQDLVLRQIALIYKLTNGQKDILACGGLDSLGAVLSASRAGANAFQLLTPLTREYPGPFTINLLKRQTVGWMDKLGVKHLDQIRGIGRSIYPLSIF